MKSKNQGIKLLKAILISTLFVLSVSLLRIEFFGFMGSRVPWGWYLTAVIFSSFYAGFFAGLFACFISCLAVYFGWHFFASHSFISENGDWVQMAVFVINSLLISWLAEAMLRHRRGILKAQRELEEKNNQLIALNDNLPGSFTYQISINAAGWPELSNLSNSIEKIIKVPARVVQKDLEFINQVVHEKDRVVFQLALDQALRDGAPLYIDVRVKSENGQDRWANFRSTPRRTADGRLVNDGIFTDITERKNAEIALLTSEERFRSFFDHSNEVFYSMDVEGRFTYISANFRSILGYNPEDQVGKAAIETFVHPDDRMICLDCIQKMQAGELETANMEYRVLHSNGTWLWICNIASAIRNNQGQISAFHGVGFDISSRKMAEQAIQLQAAIATNISEGICLINTKDAAILFTSPNLDKMLGYEKGELIGKHISEIIYPDGEGKVIEEIVNALNIQGTWKKELQKRKKDGEVIWTNTSLSTMNHPEYGTVWLSVCENITEKKKVQDALKLQAEIVANMSEGVCLVAAETTAILYTSPNFNKMFGYEEGELIGKNIGMTTSNTFADPAETTKKIQELLDEKGHWENELQKIKKNGELFWVNVKITTLEHPDYGTVRVCVYEDISEKKKAEEAIRLQAEIVNNMSEGVSLVRASDGTILYTSPVFDKMFAYERGELIGRNNSDLYAITEKSPEEKTTEINAILQVNNYWSGETLKIRKDRSVFWSNTVISSMNHPRYGKIWVSVHENIDERKKADDALKKSQERFKLIVRSTRDGWWDYDVLSGEVFYSARWMEIIGYEPQDFTGNLDFGMNAVHPDDKLQMDRLIENLFQLKDQFPETEVRLRHKDGHYVPLLSRWLLTVDEDGRPIRVCGSNIDLTERKMAEAAIKESNELLNQAGELALVSGWVYDLVENKMNCSAEYYNIHELVPGLEISLEKDLSFFHPEDRDRATFLMEKVIHQGEPFNGVFRKITGSGKLIWIRKICKPILIDGKVLKVVSAIQDITETRRIEQELTSQQLKNQQMITEMISREQESERRSLSYDLNEDINQILATVKIELAMAKTGNKNKEQLLKDGYLHLGEVIKKINSLSSSIDTPSMIQMGFLHPVALLIDRISAKNDLVVNINNESKDLKKLDFWQNLILYRIVQEQLNIIVQYGKANLVLIKILTAEEAIQMTISDNGVGYDQRQFLSESGLKKIQSRLNYYQGVMNITTESGKGCMLEVILPINIKS